VVVTRSEPPLQPGNVGALDELGRRVPDEPGHLAAER
jgi:hypothetical protein